MSRKKTNPNIRLQADERKSLLEAVRTPVFYKLKENAGIIIPLGTARDGEMKILDFSNTHHLLAAGSVMSGKTKFLNCIIASVALTCQPEETRLILIDTTRIEFLSYNRLPHLVQPVVITTEESIETFHRIVDEASARSCKLEAAGVADIRAYNRQKDENMRLPYWVIVIYELSDLMYGFRDKTEALLGKIARFKLDTGIHLVMATQRPERAVITDTLKAAFPARICFSVNEAVDSMTILGAAGAEKLHEAGEMLYFVRSQGNPEFLCGYTISDSEIDRLVSSYTLPKNP